MGRYGGIDLHAQNSHRAISDDERKEGLQERCHERPGNNPPGFFAP